MAGPTQDARDAALAEKGLKNTAPGAAHLGSSRWALFEDLDRPALKTLPQEPYEFAAWQERCVGLDYHVVIDKHYYPVPHTLLREKLWARLTQRTVEIFHRGLGDCAIFCATSNRWRLHYLRSLRFDMCQ